VQTVVDLFARALGTMISRHGKPYADNTLVTYRGEIAAFAAWAGERTLDDLDRDTVLAHLAEMRAAGYAPTYIQTRDKVLRVFLDWCVEHKMLAEHPLSRVPRATAADPPVVTLSDAEVGRLLDVCPNDTWLGVRAQAMIHVLWRCGLRAWELCNLTPEDYDRERRHLRVRGVKSIAARRTVGVPDDAALAVDDWLVRGLGTNTEGTTLFPSERGGPLTRQALTHHIQRLGKRAGLTGVHPHQLRHTFACNFLRAGGDLYLLSRLLGHSTLQMTTKYLRAIQAEEAADMHRELRLPRGGRVRQR
jgi:integrase/recombinase XerD